MKNLKDKLCVHLRIQKYAYISDRFNFSIRKRIRHKIYDNVYDVFFRQINNQIINELNEES